MRRLGSFVLCLGLLLGAGAVRRRRTRPPAASRRPDDAAGRAGEGGRRALSPELVRPVVPQSAEDFNEAKAHGKRFAVIFEQRGCPYCMKMHTEVLSQRYINDYVRQNFDIVQLNLWGAREVTDFDGTDVRARWPSAGA